MKLKQFIQYTCGLMLLAGSALSCSKATEPEAKVYEQIGRPDNAETEAYYAQLRAYKERAENYGRPVAFGWFSQWNPVGFARQHYLESIPDSMDIVSIWSGNWPLSLEQRRDMKLVQEKKGTKILACMLFSHLGKGCTPAEIYEKARTEGEAEGLNAAQLADKLKRARWSFWGFEDGVLGSEQHYAAMAKYAKAIADSLDTYGYDGLDIDWEPQAGFNDDDNTFSSHPAYISRMIEELSKYMGPKSKPEARGRKLLLLDGELTHIPSDLGGHFDYLVTQAYGDGTARLNHRFETYKRHFGDYGNPERIIVTENFESYSVTGGKLLEQAAYNPPTGRKGGFGAYRFDGDYNNDFGYGWMRKGIQLNQKAFEEYQANNNN